MNIEDPIEIIKECKAILAPLSGVSDVPFRLMTRKFGCKFAYTEMIDVNGLAYNNLKTMKMLDRPEEDTPLGVQLVGENAEKIVDSAKRCEDKGFDVLDINAGCPARKVVKCGKGSALLKDPKKLKNILKKVVKNINIPVTLKIRSGWDDDSKNYLEISKIAEGEGVKSLCVHTRTQKQMYRGKPDHSITKEIKESVKIPVIASGNIFTPEDAKEVLDYTGCDGVALARGILGKPWLFLEIENYLSGKKKYKFEPTFEELKEIIKHHFLIAGTVYEEAFSFRRMYKHVAWYLKGLKNLDAFMKEYRTFTKREELFSFLHKVYLENNKHLKWREKS